MNNAISIVIPVFNSEKTIEPLVMSLIQEISQDHKIEIILVNDCSTDQSEEKCSALFQKFPNFHTTSKFQNFSRKDCFAFRRRSSRSS